MPQFTDAKGRTWSVTISTSTVRRVQKVLDVNLLAIVEDSGELAKRLSTDPLLLVDVLFVACQDEAERQGVNADEFGCGLYGDELEAASTAMWAALIAFFPPAKRQLLAKALGELKALEAKALEYLAEHLDSPDVDAALAAAFERTKKLIDQPAMPSHDALNEGR